MSFLFWGMPFFEFFLCTFIKQLLKTLFTDFLSFFIPKIVSVILFKVFGCKNGQVQKRLKRPLLKALRRFWQSAQKYKYLLKFYQKI